MIRVDEAGQPSIVHHMCHKTFAYHLELLFIQENLAYESHLSGMWYVAPRHPYHGVHISFSLFIHLLILHGAIV